MKSFAHIGDKDFYRCDLTVQRADKQDYRANGHIVADNSSLDFYTLLTLEPPEVSGIDISARIVFTSFEGRNYNFMQLHKRGFTASPLVYSIIEESFEDGNLYYEDNKGSYDLKCIKL